MIVFKSLHCGFYTKIREVSSSSRHRRRYSSYRPQQIRKIWLSLNTKTKKKPCETSRSIRQNTSSLFCSCFLLITNKKVNVNESTCYETFVLLKEKTRLTGEQYIPSNNLQTRPHEYVQQAFEQHDDEEDDENYC